MKTTRWKRYLATLTILLLAATLLAACGQAGERQTVTETVALAAADDAAVELRMGAGNLMVSGGAATLMEGTFTFSVKEWEPEVTYEVTGGTGQLLVAQPALANIGTSADAENSWNVQLNDGVPMTLDVGLGAGESNLDLSGLNLQAVELQTGAGAVELDLGGAFEEPVDVAIRGGVGKLTVLLPTDVGVLVNVDQGIGAVNTEGLSNDGAALVNEAYRTSGATLTLDIEAGIGEINLEVVG
jgi:hypothetical protein